ncbi:hypothetical protein BURPS1106B_2092 [Burkholderia pseudomallei 1106b]|nr:hypothetical protein BURPS1106B_2092 [Burkholderia pseudomallei 1106b]
MPFAIPADGRRDRGGAAGGRFTPFRRRGAKRDAVFRRRSHSTTEYSGEGAPRRSSIPMIGYSGGGASAVECFGEQASR